MSDDTYIASLLASVESWITSRSVRFAAYLHIEHAVDDLQQEARIAALRAAARFDPGYYGDLPVKEPFRRFAIPHMRGAMLRYGVANARPVRVPEHLVATASIVGVAIDALHLDHVETLLGAAETADAAKCAEISDHVDHLAAAIGTLKPTYAAIMRRRSKGESLRDIAGALGVSTQAVAQIHAKALKSLRKRLAHLRSSE